MSIIGEEQKASDAINCSNSVSLICGRTYIILNQLGELPHANNTVQLVDGAPLTLLTSAGTYFPTNYKTCDDVTIVEHQQPVSGQIVATALCDSLSQEILHGNDVCLPSYETLSQNNSLEKLPLNDSLSRTVGFLDSNQSRLNIVDISFSINDTNNENVGMFNKKYSLHYEKFKLYSCDIVRYFTQKEEIRLFSLRSGI